MKKCKTCGEIINGMNGYFYDDGEYYCDNGKCLPYTEEEWETLHKEDPEEHYWSEFDFIDEIQGANYIKYVRPDGSVIEKLSTTEFEEWEVDNLLTELWNGEIVRILEVRYES